ncbi:hypothetical protein EKH83_10385 [Arcticibacter tournemirensis]|uniref:Rhamnogalacturonase A/B/Epimerase-like pectate lyase domain-containing protein n=2 Tax=Arcticibacter tournemirensis TaxID=699437 RepID=A0A4Q0M8Z5_9SPHI|nr:hypothetical protein EKH83_10385 [Arcticibacter tournemirensis]
MMYIWRIKHCNMKMRLFLSIIFTTCAINQLNAQMWRSELYPANWKSSQDKTFYSDMLIQDFSYAGYHRGEKEIPSDFKTVMDVTKSPYNADNTGKEDVTSVLQRAIDDAGSVKGGCVVYLPEGIYKVSVTTGKSYCLILAHSNIVLKGAGAEKTFILNSSAAMRSKAIVRIAPANSSPPLVQGKQLITKDLLSPSMIVPVQSTNGFKPGDMVLISNEIDNEWITEHHMLKYWKDMGRQLGGQKYYREIVKVNSASNELTIDIPIRYTLKMAQKAGLSKTPAMLREVGIENLSIGNKEISEEGDWTEESYKIRENPSYQSHDSWAIAMEKVSDGWIRKVASYCPTGNSSQAHLLSNGIKVSQTKNISIIECNFKKPQYGGGGGNGYMYRIMGNETLIKDCVAEFSRHGFVLSGMTASGNVFLNCLDKDSGWQTGTTGNEKTSGSGSDHHMHFSHSNLFDRCTVENSFFAAGWRKWGGSAIHGITGAHSVYWNLRSNGTQAYAVQTQQGRYGYVIGTSGNKPDVRTSAWEPGTEWITDPVDFVEGKGKGEDLNPQSLYLDQCNRRLRSNVPLRR